MIDKTGLILHHQYKHNYADRPDSCSLQLPECGNGAIVIS